MTIGSFGIDPDTGQFTVEYGARVVTTTEGTLICLSSSLEEFGDVAVEFPDGDKDHIYMYRIRRTGDIEVVSGEPSVYAWIKWESCQTTFTRLPMEFEEDIILGPAPEGADVFVGQVKFTRVTDPTHTWFDQSIIPLLEEDVWHTWNGSGMLEAVPGLVRGIHLEIKDGNLVLTPQMSVMGPPGGFGEFGEGPNPEWEASVSGTNNIGGEIRASTTNATRRGFPTWTSTSSPYRKDTSAGGTNSGPGNNPPFIPAALRQRNLHYVDGNNKCSLTDPTNYTSIYDFDIRGWFGRRS